MAVPSVGFDKAINQEEELDVSTPLEVEVEDDLTDEEQSYGDDVEESPDLSSIEFGGNLADAMDETELSKIASDCIETFTADDQSRSDWKDSYIHGLKYLGLKVEERSDPWPGACGVFHPLLTEAVVRFESQAIIEIFPSGGPVRTKILGTEIQSKTDRAKRIEEEMNYITTEKMPEYRGETEQLLFRLPLAGSCFRKVYPDPLEHRPSAIMVPAEDFVISYGATSLKSCDRYTHVMKRSSNDLRKLQATGFYSDIDLNDPAPEYTDINEATDEITGQNPSVENDDRHTVLEMHCDYDFGEDDDIDLPYIITIEKGDSKILSIRRNWLEQDPAKKKRVHFAHYQYMPGMGFYGIGLVHMIGGLAESATSILRQLVDSGTLNNIQSGFKTKGLRVKNEDEPLAPGEFRDIDVGSGTIRDSIFPLPTKEPSPTLYQLLGNIIDEGRRMASIADLDVGDMSGNAPVGTTLALLERSMKIMSAVHARLHAAFKEELKLIANIVVEYMPPQYEWDESGQFNRQEDFKPGGQVNIIPVSDPNSATMAQRVIQFQAVAQMAASSPDLYNMPLLHRQGLESLQVKDAESLVPLPEEAKPRDPITENMGFITGVPSQVFQHQDHNSHMQAHLAFAMDPKIQELVGQSSKAAIVRGAIESHVAEHLAHHYRQQIEKEIGVPLPPPSEQLDPEMENKLSGLVADAANRVLYRNQNEIAVQRAAQQAEDPQLKLQSRELDIKDRELSHKIKIDNENIDEKKNARESRAAIDSLELGIEATVEEAKLNADINRDAMKATAEFAKIVAQQIKSAQAQGNEDAE